VVCSDVLPRESQPPQSRTCIPHRKDSQMQPRPPNPPEAKAASALIGGRHTVVRATTALQLNNNGPTADSQSAINRLPGRAYETGAT